jgi:translin
MSATQDLDAIAQRIREALTQKHQARERAYTLSRQVVRDAANTIRAVHRGETVAAEGMLAATRASVQAIDQAIAEQPDLRYTGYVDDAQKEYAEACLTICMAAGTPFPGPEELRVSHSAYLNGMAEAASEMRRHLLDALRRGEVARCEGLLASMDDVYNVLVTMDFPDAVTGGLRRTTDQLRAVLERTRGDLTLAIVQDRLAGKLSAMDARLGGDGTLGAAPGRLKDFRPEGEA